MKFSTMVDNNFINECPYTVEGVENGNVTKCTQIQSYLK